MLNFLKGIIVGIGGIAPGLSGSVLLVILGLYHKTINAIGTLFKNFKKNVLFLLPLCLGFGVGVIIFSKIVDFLLANYEMQTRFAFLGLVIGTIPLFYKEVKKEGFSKKYYIFMLIALIAGFALFGANRGLFPEITNPNLLQSVFLGAILNILINILLIPMFQSIGAAIGSLCAEIAVCCYQTFKVRKELKIKLYLKQSLPFVILGIIMYTIVIFVPFIHNYLITIIIKVLVGSIIYLTLSTLYYKFILKQIF